MRLSQYFQRRRPKLGRYVVYRLPGLLERR
jgi:hypothetical protein